MHPHDVIADKCVEVDVIYVTEGAGTANVIFQRRSVQSKQKNDSIMKE